MVSQTAEYALRAVAWLAENSDGARTVHEIAAGASLPAEYLSKILQELARTGLVISQRGPSGGYRLARPARDLTVFQVVDAVSPVQRIHECPLGRKHEGGKLCALHRLLDDTAATVERAFRNVTIDALLRDPNRQSMLCRPSSNGSVSKSKGNLQ